MKSKIEINNTELCIRPSSIDSFLGCSYQWARVFLSGEKSIPNARAAIGTGIHAGAESLWRNAMEKQDKDAMYMPGAIDAAIEKFKEEAQNGLHYEYGQDDNTAINEIVAGTGAFHDDIVPFTDIPDIVEGRYTMEIDHPIVKEIGGTVDYLKTKTGVMADIKSSGRKATASNYEIQQSTYKILAEHNNIPIDHNLIQNVVLTKVPNGQILELTTNVDKAKTVINNLLDTLEILTEDKIKPELLFRGNPKYYLCSEKYCNFYKTCIFVKGEDPAKSNQHVVKI